jgi:hypothetical protein
MHAIRAVITNLAIVARTKCVKAGFHHFLTKPSDIGNAVDVHCENVEWVRSIKIDVLAWAEYFLCRLRKGWIEFLNLKTTSFLNRTMRASTA